MKRNESNLDRIIRVILGAGLVVAGVLVGGTVGIVLYVLAAVMFITAITGFCLLYKLFGIDTCRASESCQG